MHDSLRYLAKMCDYKMRLFQKRGKGGDDGFKSSASHCGCVLCRQMKTGYNVKKSDE